MSRGDKALIVDDDIDARGVVAECLRLHGFAVIEAQNGLEALLRVKREHPSVVVLDLQMPRLGGLDALKRIRVFDPGITVVVVSGCAEEFRERALAQGASAVLTKPVDVGELVKATGIGPLRQPVVEDSGGKIADGSPPVPQGQVATGRALVVDDDPQIRGVLEEFLTLNGYRVRAVPDAAEALRAIVHETPDVVLLDIDMPGLSGVAALPSIRAVCPDTAVIMVSATASVETAKLALAQGAFDYVVKPVDFAYLARSLEAALSMNRL